MYALLIVLVVGAVELPERDWYLSRKLYEVQVRRGLDMSDYEAAKKNLDSMSAEDQRAFVGAERIRAEQNSRINKSRMNVWPVNPRPIYEPRNYYWPYPSYHRSYYDPSYRTHYNHSYRTRWHQYPYR